HYSTVGACESLGSPYRDWFVFRNNNVPCGAGDYEGWFGFDSIPVLNKSNPAVQQYFLTGSNSVTNSVTKHWLNLGAGGWRLDVSGDPSFPAGYWETFRQVAKGTRADALLISETWQKDSTLLRMLRGDRLDTTMNYRLRDAVLGLLAPGNFDSKGFADSGRIITPSEFAARISSIREDYPDAAYYSLMNLLDSHDTERILWTLTPGTETRADKEFNAANLAQGKQRLQIASLIQFTMPGAPTVYYGDEVGLTGDDDPDDRRTYPWADKGGSPDNALLSHYSQLSQLRETFPSLTLGDLRLLLADDAAGVVAYGRKTGDEAAVVVVNRNNTARTVNVPVAGYLPDGAPLTSVYGVGNPTGVAHNVAGGLIAVSLNPMSGVLLHTGAGLDLTPPAAPSGLQVTNEGSLQVSLAWNSVSGATGYNVYRSPLTGGGYVKANGSPVAGTTFTDTGVQTGRTYFYVVKALDSVGNESAASNEVSALPHYTIGWANLQWPPTLSHTISVTNRTDTVYGQVWIDGVTNAPGPAPTLRAQLGFGPDGSDPANNPNWAWVDASFNVDAGNNDEFRASLLPESVGVFDYAYRYSTTNGRDWTYADLDGIPNGYSPAQAGSLTVNSSGDTTAPAVPQNLRITTASPAGIGLEWDAVTGDASLYGYEVLRSDNAGGPYTQLVRLTSANYTDTSVAQGASYYYVVRAVDG
ncbi:MAG: alpha-amylase family glycosyl hydrolase, partial [Anaerolineales bacterium]